MNNSVFGKTMENIRKRVDVRLATDEQKLSKLAAKPTFKVFNKNLVAVHKIKDTLTLDRPAYVGMFILDLSKTLMYAFHCNDIKKKYGSKAKLLFRGTDSLTYEITAKDVYKDFGLTKISLTIVIMYKTVHIELLGNSKIRQLDYQSLNLQD